MASRTDHRRSIVEPMIRVELLEHDVDMVEAQGERRHDEIRTEYRADIAQIRADIKGVQRILIGLLITMVGTLFAALTNIVF